MFSFDPRCHGAYGSQKYTGMPEASYVFTPPPSDTPAQPQQAAKPDEQAVASG
jgi:hypothetical protein